MSDRVFAAGSEYVKIGTLSRPHGLRGHLKALLDPDSRETLKPGSQIRLVGDSRIREAVLEEITHLGRTCHLRFAETRDRKGAEEIAGWSIYRNIEDLPVLADDEYYWYQMAGSRVLDEEGRFLGILEEMFSTPAHDVWVARSGEKEFLIPAIDEAVITVDREKKTVRVKNLKELWEVDGR